VAEQNDCKLLPDTLEQWHSQAKLDNPTIPFVYFVTDEQNENNARKRDENPYAPEVRATFLHLLILTGLLKMNAASDDVKNQATIHQCVPSGSGNEVMLTFPFPDTGVHINDATSDLFLFDHPWFKFKNPMD